jgi:drug/metabolite transporter, DME family
MPVPSERQRLARGSPASIAYACHYVTHSIRYFIPFTRRSLVQNKSNSARTGLLIIMLAAMLWGTGNIIAKFVYQVAATNSISIAFFRMALSVPPLCALCWFTLRQRMFHISLRQLLPMLVAGSFVALYQVAFYAAIPRTGVAIATIIALCSAPVIVAVLSAVIARERPQAVVLMALACAISGTLLLVQVEPSAEQSQTNTLTGALFALLSGALYAANVMVGRKLGASSSAHPLQTVTFGFVFGALVLLVIGLASNATASGLIISYPAQGWAGLLYLGVISTAIAYALFYAGMRSTSSTKASIATLMEPLTATLIAWQVFDEPLSSRVVLGGSLLVVAMLLLLWERR